MISVALEISTEFGETPFIAVVCTTRYLPSSDNVGVNVEAVAFAIEVHNEKSFILLHDFH